jgi:hypothetical protein
MFWFNQQHQFQHLIGASMEGVGGLHCSGHNLSRLPYVEITSALGKCYMLLKLQQSMIVFFLFRELLGPAQKCIWSLEYNSTIHMMSCSEN